MCEREREREKHRKERANERVKENGAIINTYTRLYESVTYALYVLNGTNLLASGTNNSSQIQKGKKKKYFMCHSHRTHFICEIIDC